MARLVLIDKKSVRVCGDTAALAPRFPEWAKIAAENSKDKLEGLATVAARLLDENRGIGCRLYKFSPFAANDASEGYFVFDCDYEWDNAPPVVTYSVDPKEAIGAVMTGCFYVGYVRCEH